MTGVPSIVMGLFIFIIWVLHFGPTRAWRARSPWPA
jgi:ABC-type phosphate transport system permease subunit